MVHSERSAESDEPHVVAGYVSIGKLVVLSSGGQPASVFEVLHWILASWCLSIATQVISTCLIAGMIWWHARRNVAAKRRYAALIAIIMESGVAYTLSTVFLLVFAELKTQAGAIPAHMVTQIAVCNFLICFRFLKISCRPLSQQSLSFVLN